MMERNLKEYRKLVRLLKVEQFVKKSKLSSPLKWYWNYRNKLVEKVVVELEENTIKELHPPLEKDIILTGTPEEILKIEQEDKSRNLYPKTPNFYGEPIHHLVLAVLRSKELEIEYE